MPVTLRTSLSFMLAAVMMLTIGLTLAGPAHAVNSARPSSDPTVLYPPESDGVTPVTPNNPIGELPLGVPTSGSDLVFWRTDAGPDAARAVINRDLLAQTRFSYRTSDQVLYQNLTFKEAVSLCESEQEACRAQVRANVAQQRVELNKALAVATSQCSNPSRKLLFSISPDNRVRIGIAGAVSAVLWASGAGVMKMREDGYSIAASSLVGAAGVAIATLAGNFVDVAGVRKIRGESIITWNLGVDAMRDLIAQLRVTGPYSERTCAEAARAIRIAGSVGIVEAAETNIADPYGPFSYAGN